MRVLIQNVLSSNVLIKNEEIARIKRGFLLFVAFSSFDNELIIEKMIKKILGLRIFQDENGKTNLSLKEINGQILSVSQFSLYADISRGNRPSFTKALNPLEANKLYNLFNNRLEETFGHIEKGQFGEDMIVNIENDGPFTIFIDSEDL